MIETHPALLALLASSMGAERAAALVAEECARLGIAHPPPPHALDRLIAALCALPAPHGPEVRQALGIRVTPSIQPQEAAARPSAKSEAAGRLTLDALLAPALGNEKALQVVAEACVALRLDPTALSPEQQRRVLDALSAGGDYVATVARFAKARVLLSR